MTEKHVALLIETSTSWGANIVKGIADYAASHANWYFYLEPRGKYERLTLPRDWTGDGVIARVTYEELAREIMETGKPAVNVSWYSFDSVTILGVPFSRPLQMRGSHVIGLTHQTPPGIQSTGQRDYVY